MFFQYLRGRQSELLALRATSTTLGQSGKIVPIIEPVNTDSARLGRALQDLVSAGVRTAVVTNPVANSRRVAVGNMLRNRDMDAALVADPLVLPALLLLTSSTARGVQNFFGLYAGRDVCLVHYETPSAPAAVAALSTAVAAHSAAVIHVFESRTPTPYRNSFPSGGRILLTDGFRRQANNAAYAGEEFFSDGHLTYAKAGFHGCGDYSVIGDHFALGGSNPYAVVLHMTYQRVDGTIWVHHFVSDSNTTTANPAGKFIEAAQKARRFAHGNAAFAATAACQELLAYLTRRHFPGLPKLKELTMRHHLELMAAII